MVVKQDPIIPDSITGATAPQDNILPSSITGIESTTQDNILPSSVTTPPPTQADLEAKIKSGTFSGAEASAYNKMIGSQTGARDLALGSTEAIASGDLKTTISPEEAKIVQQSGVTEQQIKQGGVRADLTGTTAEQFKQEVQQIPTKTEAPTIPQPTDFTKIQSVEDWKTQTGGGLDNLETWIEQRYGTQAIKNPDGSITATINGQDFKWILDDAGNPIKTAIPLDSNSIYNQLLAGKEIKDTTNPAYTSAKARYDITNRYQSMTEDQLYNAYVNGEISSDLEKDIASNPYLAAAKEKYNQKLTTDTINNEVTSLLNTYNGQKTETKTGLEKISDKFISLFSSMGKSEADIQTFKNYMASNYPDLVNQTKEYNAQKTLLQQKIDARDATYKEILDTHPGITLNRAMLLASRQNESLNNEIKSMTYALSELGANINYQTDMASKDYDYTLQQQARQDRLAQEARGYAFDILSTQQQQEYQQQALAEQRAYEQKYNIPTSIIEVGDKQQLINTRTGEVIKEYDIAVTDSTTKAPDIKNIGTSDNPNYVSYNFSTQEWEPISVKGATKDEFGNLDYTSLDFTTNQDLINQYQGEASFKNNNPTGMTWGISSNLKNKFDEAGIQYTQGTPRPTAEGGAYIKFASVQDGLDAYRIALTEAGSDNIYNRLATWVGTMDTAANDRYARDIMAAAGISKGTRFSELNETQLGNLMEAQLQRESPNFYRELVNLSQQEATTTKPLTDKQFTQSNQIITSFKSDPQVKAFEEAYSQGLNLLSSLADKTGPGDVAGIFQFMKTLDPQSVVRESEFAVAAKSAGVTEYLGNTWDRITKGKTLTDAQAQAFGKLAKQFIINKASLYDTKYQDGVNRLRTQGIPVEGVFPTNIADQMRQILTQSDYTTPTTTTGSTGTVEDLISNFFGTTPTSTTGVGSTNPNTFINY